MTIVLIIQDRKLSLSKTRCLNDKNNNEKGNNDVNIRRQKSLSTICLRRRQSTAHRLEPPPYVRS